MSITLLFYAIKATFRLAIVSIKYHIHGAESKNKKNKNKNKKTHTNQTGKQIQEKHG